MYNTPLGIRILQGAERMLFVESLGMIVDNMRVFDHEFGIAVFDDLGRNQKIAILHFAARSLLSGDQPPPPLTAVLEGAVAGIYQHVREMLAMELEERDEDPSEELDWLDGDTVEDTDFDLPTWRERVFAACRELGVGGDLPTPDNRNRDAWDIPLTGLEDCVLWDTDWGMQEALDANPDASRRAKAELGIDEDYFVAVPPDPTDEEADRLLVELIELTAEGR